MDRAAHAMITAGVTTAFHPLVYAKTLIQVLLYFAGVQTLRTQDTSDPRHFGPSKLRT